MIDISKLSYFEKCDLAYNSSSIEELTSLSNEESWAIRWHVAKNFNTSHHILKRLFLDKNESVRYWAQHNPNFKLKAFL